MTAVTFLKLATLIAIPKFAKLIPAMVEFVVISSVYSVAVIGTGTASIAVLQFAKLFPVPKFAALIAILKFAMLIAIPKFAMLIPVIGLPRSLPS